MKSIFVRDAPNGKKIAVGGKARYDYKNHVE